MICVMTISKDVDPRIERTRRVVLEATAELIGECGFGRTSIEAISERCGVARSTIYRHWPDRSELLLETVVKRMGSVEATDTGDLRSDLIRVYSHLGSLLTDQETRSLAASFIAESNRDPELAALHKKFTQSRRKRSSGLIKKAVDRGDLPPETDRNQMADDLAAGIFFRALILQQSIDDEWIESHVDRWISAYSAG